MFRVGGRTPETLCPSEAATCGASELQPEWLQRRKMAIDFQAAFEGLDRIFGLRLDSACADHALRAGLKLIL